MAKKTATHKNSHDPLVVDSHKRDNFLKMAKTMAKKGNLAPPFKSWDDMKANKRMSDAERAKFTEELKSL